MQYVEEVFPDKQRREESLVEVEWRVLASSAKDGGPMQGLLKAEISWPFLRAARVEMHRTFKKASFAAFYGNAKWWLDEREFMVMYLMGGEI